MNRKQVVKVKETVNAWGKVETNNYYGIAINENQVLLENSRVVAEGSMYNTTVEISATRNVPSALRKSLEDGLSAYLDLEKKRKELEILTKEVNSLRRFVNETMPLECNKAKGYLSDREFIEIFEKNLSRPVKQELERCKHLNVGYGSYRDDNGTPYDFYIENYKGKALRLERNVDISKYYRTENEMVYQEYDGCMQFHNGAEKTKTYKKYISEYSNPLPVKSKCEEFLELGDKDYLIYNCVYRIPLDKPLTEEYAKKLAEDFCDPKKDLTKVKKAKGVER